jgi:putative spermidine/putrescine transport system substrate-binding protein
MKMISARRLTAVAGAALLAVVSGCGTSSDDGTTSSDGGFTPPDLEMKQSLGDMEGQVNILAWPGYAEDGTNDPKYDWVSAFEKQTGCQANVKYFNTSDEAVKLMQTGQYDVVSASGDASLRLIASGDVAPVNTDLVKSYADIESFLKDRDWNSVDGQMYGIPHGWGANLLAYNTEVVKPAPTSWGAVFEGAADYPGKVTAYNSPIYIADAALYLMKHQPDLGIENPYALDQDQLQAAVDLLKDQNQYVGEYWSDYLTEVSGFKTGDTVIGTAWQYNALTAQAEGAPIKTVFPEETSTGWSDTWMINPDSDNSNCGYAWMDYITSPGPQAQVAEYFGEAPANTKACDLTVDKNFCDSYHAEDKPYSDKLWYWTTPISACLDGRTDVKCTDYGDWTQAWTEIKG